VVAFVVYFFLVVVVVVVVLVKMFFDLNEINHNLVKYFQMIVNYEKNIVMQ